MKPLNALLVLNRYWILVSCLTVSGLMYGCGSDGGPETVPLQNTDASIQEVNYTGPAPATEDVANFKRAFWDNLVATNRCGQCHGAGGQVPTFVRGDDINLAYQDASGIVNLSTPAESSIVSKVGGGHNCWLASDQACADTMAAYIASWAGGEQSASTTVELSAPPIRDAGSSKSFPADSTLFVSTVYPLLTANCATCHTDEAAVPQQPYFASSDVAVAYEASKSKIDLDSPGNSRFSVRLSDEFHNCWSDCAANGQTMLSAITGFSDAIVPTQIDPSWVVSKALRLTDGIVASSGGRSEANMIAFYEFKTGEGFTAFDTSGVEPQMNLTLSGDVSWVGGWGIRIADGKAQALTSTSKKLHDMIKATGEYSIEAWVAPANVTQEGPARIISYSAGVNARNFTLGQTLYNYDYLNRSSTTDSNGEPALSTADDAELLQATLQHVVVTYDAVNGRRLYVNGQSTGDVDPVGAGNLTEWDDTFAFVLGNEASNDRLWQGVIRMVAIHNRAMNQEQITQNFEVGVGEKFFLLFSVSHLVDVPDSYIVLEVSQFDSYSYLFNTPFFVSLDANARPSNIPVQGISIGVNGKEASIGQVYRNVKVTLDAATYTETGQVISSLGTVLALDKGPEADEFFLTFERLGSHENVRVEASPTAPGTPADLPAAPDIGLRIFGEINASMSAATTVPATNSNVMATYNTVKQALPASENIGAFLSSQQMAITQLAIEYCNALVEDTTLRASYFTGFNFSTNASTVFDATGKGQIISPLITHISGSSLDSQPDVSDIEAEAGALIDRLSNCGGACPAGRTETVVKATCAAILGSAVMLVQ